ncbi:MAG: 3-isopropylmalate dehydratase small subunit [Candidatus Geothermarchaeales archaeon]
MGGYTVRGRVWRYGDNIDTDGIFPGRYLNIFKPEEMARHAMEGVDPGFLKKMRRGDVVVAGKNFGCGSSRDQAATCLKYAGVSAIIAKSFSRIFYRNAINQGLPILTSEEIHGRVEDGQEVEVDASRGLVKNLTTGETIKATPLPDFVMDIIVDGGLIPHLRKKVGKR